MNYILMAAPLALCGLANSASNSPIATVTSRAPFSVQGVRVPVVGGTAWPVAAGDTIETNSAPAEIRLKDGTRIFVPAASRFVVGRLNPGGASLRANLSGSQSRSHSVSEGSPSLSSNGARNILDNGALVPPPPLEARSLASPGSAPRITGTTPAILSLTALLQTFGVNSPIIGTIDQALASKSAIVQFDAGTNTFYITGVQVVVGNSPAQAVTFIVSPTRISVTPGTINPGTPPPPPIVTVIPGTPSPCKGSSVKPADVSNSIVTVPTGGSC